MNDAELRTRVRNPNKEFDSFFWRPKNRFLRFIVNKYINIIEVLGYVFGLTMLTAIIYAWTVKHDEWSGWVTSTLEPADSLYTTFLCRAELSGTNADSLSIGDSVQIQLNGTSDLPLTVNATLPDTALSARLIATAPSAFNAFIDSLTAGYVGTSVTAKTQGVYTATSVARPEITLELRLGPSDSPDSARILAGRTFMGVLSSGTRHVTLELPNPMGDSLTARLKGWARDSFAAQGFVLDGKRYRMESLDKIVMKSLTIEAQTPLANYVGFKQRPRGMKEYRQKDFKVKCSVSVTPPPYVCELARTYQALTGERLSVKLRICSYRISWGRKLVRKK